MPVVTQVLIGKFQFDIYAAYMIETDVFQAGPELEDKIASSPLSKKWGFYKKILTCCLGSSISVWTGYYNNVGVPSRKLPHMTNMVESTMIHLPSSHHFNKDALTIMFLISLLHMD